MEARFTAPTMCPVLIGRVHELTYLHLLIDRAHSGQEQVVLVSGEAGIGKSRLVTEAKAYAAAHDFLLLFERQAARVWGELALVQGDAARALQTAEHLIVSAPGDILQPIPHLLALKGEALLALKRLEEAAKALEDAKFGAEQRQAPSILWRIQCSLGRVYHLLKREEQAQREWSDARDIIAKLAVTIDETASREHFLRTALASLTQGKQLSPEVLTSSKYGGLSAREREVAALVAQGRSNRDIAASLIVSERTAEAHVSNILGKLGFTTRVQIAAWAVEIGLTTTR